MGKGRKTGLLGEGEYQEKVMFNNQGKIWRQKECEEKINREKKVEWTE